MNSEYVLGFMDATKLSEYDAHDQLSAMSNDIEQKTYEQGYADGKIFNEIFA
jgi:hypothetical protein